MAKIYLRLLLLFWLNLMTGNCREIAYVDLYAAFLLHPEMQRFHTPNFRFLRNPAPKPGQSLEDFEAARRSAMFDLASKMSVYAQEFKASLARINGELRKVMVEGGAGFRSRMDLMRNQWQAEENEKKKNVEEVADQYYFTPEESKAEFVKLWGELREALRALQKRHKILAFIPVNQAASYKIPKTFFYKIDREALSGYRSSWDTFYEKAGVVSEKELELRMHPYRGFSEEMHSLFSAFIPSWYLPSGGIDRTLDLIRELHAKYQTSPEKLAQVLEVYELWKSEFVGAELSIYQESATESAGDQGEADFNSE